MFNSLQLWMNHPFLRRDENMIINSLNSVLSSMTHMFGIQFVIIQYWTCQHCLYLVLDEKLHNHECRNSWHFLKIIQNMQQETLWTYFYLTVCYFKWCINFCFIILSSQAEWYYYFVKKMRFHYPTFFREKHDKR